jgi:hypothetical protein
MLPESVGTVVESKLGLRSAVVFMVDSSKHQQINGTFSPPISHLSCVSSVDASPYLHLEITRNVMRRDFLQELTGVLSSVEAQLFRKTDFFQGSKWKVERLRLFNSLQDGTQKSEGRSVKSPDTSPYARALYRERHLMHKALMSFLLGSPPQGPDPWQHFEESRMLLDRNLKVRALDAALTGLRVAEEVHDLHAQLALREHLRMLYKALPKGRYERETEDNWRCLDELMTQLTNLMRYTQINDRMADLLTRYYRADDPEVRRQIDRLMDDELMTDPALALSVPAQLRFENIKAYYAQCTDERDTALEHLQRCVSLWESCPARMAYLPHLYHEALSNLTSLLITAGRLEPIPGLLARLEKLPMNGRRAEMSAFCDIELQYQLYYLNTTRLEDVIAREAAVNRGLERFSSSMSESRELVLLYNLGIAHLIMGHSKHALRYFNRIRDKGRPAARLDLQNTARMFRLMLLLEKDDTADFDHYLRSNRRNFRGHMPTFRMMEVVYGWLDTHRNEFHRPEREAALLKLQAALLPFEQQKVVGAEVLRLWVTCQMHGVTVVEMMREQKG